MIFALAIDLVGFYEAAFFFLLATSWVLSSDVESRKQRLLEAAVFSAIFVTIVFVAFKLVLKIPTPKGLLI